MKGWQQVNNTSGPQTANWTEMKMFPAQLLFAYNHRVDLKHTHDLKVEGYVSFECLGLQAQEGLPRWLTGKEPACQCRRPRFHP